MTDSNEQVSQEARNQADAVRRLVNEGVADNQTAFDHVEAESRGRDLARRLLNQRRLSAPQQEEKAVSAPNNQVSAAEIAELRSIIAERSASIERDASRCRLGPEQAAQALRG